MNGNAHVGTAGGSQERLAQASRILARLILVDDQSRFPDVNQIRDMAREILVEQLRELSEDGGGDAARSCADAEHHLAKDGSPRTAVLPIRAAQPS